MLQYRPELGERHSANDPSGNQNIGEWLRARPGFKLRPGARDAAHGTSTRNLAYIEDQRLAAAKNLNLHVVTKDGVRLFCRTELISG